MALGVRAATLGVAVPPREGVPAAPAAVVGEGRLGVGVAGAVAR